MRRSICVFAIWAVIALGSLPPVNAQEQTSVESGDASIVLTAWKGDDSPTASVLLVPGWGGGPMDVLGVAKALSAEGIPVVVLSPRGWHDSRGTASFSNALEDIRTALEWMRSSSDPKLQSDSIILGGHSWGGGMALAYAAIDTSVSHVFSIAGTDHGTFIRQYQSDPDFAAMVDPMLDSSASPNGPIRFSREGTLRELIDGESVYGLIENAEALGSRSILIFGGWEDVNTTIDDYLLPLYRALRKAGADDVTFLAYHADHGFGAVRMELHSDLVSWINR